MEEHDKMNKRIFVMILVVSLIFTSMIYSVAGKPKEYYLETQQAPEKPTITGPTTSEIGMMCEYHIRSVDPQNDDIYYEIKCSDSPVVIVETCCCCSGEEIIFEYCWDNFYQSNNPFIINARAIDIHGHEGEWASFNVLIKANANPQVHFFNRFLQQYQILYNLLVNLMNMIKNT